MRRLPALALTACLTVLLVGTGAWLQERAPTPGIQAPGHPAAASSRPTGIADGGGGRKVGAGAVAAPFVAGSTHERVARRGDAGEVASRADAGAARRPGVAGSAAVAVDRREVAGDVAETAARAEVVEALTRVDAEAGALVEEWIAIASTPASSGDEERRARIVEEGLGAAGLEAVGRDAAGNVIGVLPGRDRSAKKSVFMAHMDTVAPPAADFIVRREGDVLRGPGVRDDSSGLAAILAAARIARGAGIVPPADVLVVASVEEEVGLKGSKAFLDSRGGEVGAFVAVDGYLGQISWAATSILWMKLHFTAPGAHTLRSYQHPSTSRALAMAVESIYAIPLRRSPEELETWLNVGMLGGGEVPNAQARDAWFTVDLRSNDPETARQMERRILDVGEAAARRIGVQFDHEVLQRLEGATIPGHDRSRLVQTARAALEWLEWGEISLTPRGTADHNVAIQMGIPAIALGVTTGEGAHTPTEHADVEPYVTGVKQLVLLMASRLY